MSSLLRKQIIMFHVLKNQQNFLINNYYLKLIVIADGHKEALDLWLLRLRLLLGWSMKKLSFDSVSLPPKI